MYSFQSENGVPYIDSDRKRIERGTIMSMTDMSDIVIGATVVGVQNCFSVKEGREYTIIGISDKNVTFISKGIKYKLKPYEFITTCARRIGPVIPDSLRKGLCVRVYTDGKGYTRGDMLELTEADGDMFSFKSEKGRGTISRQVFLMSCYYV